jgi:glucose-6-phosphate dehydrogenase assembly protein OpcA
MTASADPQEIAAWRSESTDAEGISAALVRVWSEAARPPPGSDGGSPPDGGVLRTRIGNLLVYAGTVADADHAEEVLRRLTRRYPIRCLLCEARPDTGRATLAASLRILCERVGERRVCFEQIRVSADGAQAAQLGSVAATLAVHDLPTVLWCPGSPGFAGPDLAGLSDLADLVVVDSAEFGGQPEELAAVARVVEAWSGGRILADLNWNRLTDWREVIAQFFDSPTTLPLLEQIRRVELRVAAPDGVHAAGSAQALLMAAWLGSRLGWRCTGARRSTPDGIAIVMQCGSEAVEVQLGASVQGAGSALALRAVEIEAGAEASMSRFVLTASESTVDGTATVEICEGESSSRCFVFPERDEAELLGEEIETFGHERALDDALRLLGDIVQALQQAP